MTFEQRLFDVRQRFDEWKVDGLLINSSANRRWLSGFTGSAGWLLLTPSRAILATDFRYWQQAEQQAPHFELYRYKRAAGSFEAFVRAAGGQRLGVEAGHVTLAEMGRWHAIGGIDWIPLNKTVESLRAIKRSEELDRMREAASITDRVMEEVPSLIVPGQTEAELAWELEKRLREGGTVRAAFDIIVASGPNAALPHHHPGQRALQPGDAVVIDMGAGVDGYHSDLTRTFYVGDEPDERFRALYDLVLRAETTALDGILPGMTGKEADALARDIISEAGYGEQFGHGLGHGVGLEVHEAPSLSIRAEKDRLEAGMVVTVEPGVYIPDWGGIRIEDLALITDDGLELLSDASKEIR